MFHFGTIIKEELFYLPKTEQALLLTYSGTLLNLIIWLLFTRKLFLDIVSCFTYIHTIEFSVSHSNKILTLVVREVLRFYALQVISTIALCWG